MKISKAHKEFADRLNFWYIISKQEVLDLPEQHLGPNWEAVINFWLYLDTLTEDQLSVFCGKRLPLGNEEWNKVWSAARATIKYTGDAGDSVYYICTWVNTAAYGAAKSATYELIGLDKLLAQGHQPVFFPLFLNL
jgi:hypothetical protein